MGKIPENIHFQRHAHAAELMFWCRHTLPTHPAGVVCMWTAIWWDDEDMKHYVMIRPDPEVGVPVWGF